MGDLLKLILCIYVITLIVSMVIAVIKFVVDTFRWHDREEKVKIFASNDSAKEETEDKTFDSEKEPISEVKESEVIENDSESREHNTSTIFGTRSKS